MKKNVGRTITTAENNHLPQIFLSFLGVLDHLE